MKVQLDGRNITTKAMLHEYLKKQLSLPEYYGKNLDALYDVLTDWAEPLEIEVWYPEELKELLCGYGEAFLETLSDAAATNAAITVSMQPE